MSKVIVKNNRYGFIRGQTFLLSNRKNLYWWFVWYSTVLLSIYVRKYITVRIDFEDFTCSTNCNFKFSQTAILHFQYKYNCLFKRYLLFQYSCTSLKEN